MDMDFSVDLLTYAFEKNMENELFDLWKLQFPHMTSETFISFDDYKNKVMANNANYTKISYEEIETEMDKVIKAFEKGGK